MSRRTRVPGPITQDQTVGNSGERVPTGISKWISIDVNDGKWTTYDPNSTLVSSSTTANGIRFAVDKTKNDSTYRWNNSAQGSIRWHQRLRSPDGEPLAWSDFFSLEILIECHERHANTGNSQDYHGVMVGIGGNGVTNSTQGINWMGQGSTHQFPNTTDGSGQKSIIGGDSSISNDHSSTCRKVYGVISTPIDGTDADGDPLIKHAFSYCLDGNNRITNNGADAPRPQLQTFEFTGGDDVYLFVASTFAAFRDLTNLDNPEATWKIWYRVNVARDGLSPVYTPGGGVSG